MGVDTYTDARGRAVKTEYTQGDATQRSYNVAGNVLAVTDAKGNATSTVYDTRGRAIQTEDRRGKTTARYYDVNSNLVRIVEVVYRKFRTFF